MEFAKVKCRPRSSLGFKVEMIGLDRIRRLETLRGFRMVVVYQEIDITNSIREVWPLLGWNGYGGVMSPVALCW